MFLKLDGRRCVVVGGGNIATRKVLSLLKCGASVLLVSPEFCPELEKRAAAGEIAVERRPFERGDLEGATVAIAATSRRDVNEAVAAAGRDFGVPVNVVDVPDLCDFYVPAMVERGDLQIAISTGGAFPALAKRLRILLEEQFGPEYGEYVGLLMRYRQEIKARVSDSHKRAKAEEAFLELPLLELLESGRRDEAENALRECVSRIAD